LVVEKSHTAGSLFFGILEGSVPGCRRWSVLLIDRIADDRAGHAMPAAAAAAKLRARDRDDLDALLAQQGIGVHVAVVGEYDARRGTNEIGAAIPLRRSRMPIRTLPVPIGITSPPPNVASPVGAAAGPSTRACRLCISVFPPADWRRRLLLHSSGAKPRVLFV
jgi:hypothetical protein